MSEDTLKPCPMCGSKAEMSRIFGRIGVSCSECGVCIRSEEIDSEYGYDGVVRDWNTRANDAIKAEHDALQSKIEAIKE